VIRYNSLPFNFLGLPPEYSEFDRSRVVILPVPYESTTSYQAGTRDALHEIIWASRNVEPEPGGLTWKNVMDLAREVTGRRKVVGLDVVELCPRAGVKAPNFLCAKLVYKILGRVFK